MVLPKRIVSIQHCQAGLVHCLGNGLLLPVFPLKQVALFATFRLPLEEQGWCSGESARLPPMWPGPGVICGLSLLVLYSDLFRLQSPQLVEHSCSATMN